ncbi:MAG TPA: hypothetical protein VFF43_15045, partial [Caldimonas sp.]|nr:hypothetical protein [Caldimonas sp.]
MSAKTPAVRQSRTFRSPFHADFTRPHRSTRPRRNGIRSGEEGARREAARCEDAWGECRWVQDEAVDG